MTDPVAPAPARAPARAPGVAPAAQPVSAVRMLADARRLIDRGPDLGTLYQRVVRAACSVTGATYAGIVLLGVDGEVVDCAHHGLSAAQLESVKNFVGPVSRHRGSATERAEQLAAAGLRCFPVIWHSEPLAELYLPRSAALLADGHAADGTPAEDVLDGLVAMIGLALEMDDARSRCSWMSVLEDRHRIARDLHDNVMQRLFATGVGLQALASSQPPSDVARRLQNYVDELDETIDEIRNRVFGLQDDDGNELRRTPTRLSYLAVENGL